jgi:hypothetical protein
MRRKLGVSGLIIAASTALAIGLGAGPAKANDPWGVYDARLCRTQSFSTFDLAFTTDYQYKGRTQRYDGSSLRWFYQWNGRRTYQSGYVDGPRSFEQVC